MGSRGEFVYEPRTDGLTRVKRDDSPSTIWMTEKVMAAFDSNYSETCVCERGYQFGTVTRGVRFMLRL